MRKSTIIVAILGTLFATNIYLKTHHLSVPKPIATEQTQINLGDDYYQKEIDRELELKKKMQNPTIIRNQIRKVGKLTSLEGQYKYQSKIIDKGFMDLTLREITLDFTYNFGMGMDLQYITIYKVENKTVYIKIPKNRVQLQYIELNSQDSRIIEGKKMILVNQFSPSDTEILMKQSQQKVVNMIGTDKELFSDAMINLQEQLEKLVLSLGYYERVVFEIV